jgi:hypothetical protein
VRRDATGMVEAAPSLSWRVSAWLSDEYEDEDMKRR